MKTPPKSETTNGVEYSTLLSLSDGWKAESKRLMEEAKGKWHLSDALDLEHQAKAFGQCSRDLRKLLRANQPITGGPTPPTPKNKNMKTMIIALIIAVTGICNAQSSWVFADIDHPDLTASFFAPNAYEGTLTLSNQSPQAFTLSGFGNPAPYVAGWSTPDLFREVAAGSSTDFKIHYWGSPKDLTFTGYSGGDSVTLAYLDPKIPEPSTTLLGALGTLLLIRRRR